MADILNTSVRLIDSAIGPVSVTTSEVENFDIDDHVHSTVRAQAIRLMVIRQAENVDTRFTDDRMPVNIGDVSVGGF